MLDEVLERVFDRIADRLGLFRAELAAEIASLRQDQGHGVATLQAADAVTRDRLDEVMVDQGRIVGKIETIEADTNRALASFRREILEVVRDALAQVSEAAAAAREEAADEHTELRQAIDHAVSAAAEARRRLHEDLAPIKAGWTNDHGRTLPQRVSATELVVERARWTMLGAATAGAAGGAGAFALIARAFNLGP